MEEIHDRQRLCHKRHRFQHERSFFQRLSDELDERKIHAFESLLEIAHPAVDELGAAGGSASSEIVALN